MRDGREIGREIGREGGREKNELLLVERKRILILLQPKKLHQDTQIQASPDDFSLDTDHTAHSHYPHKLPLYPSNTQPVCPIR